VGPGRGNQAEAAILPLEGLKASGLRDRGPREGWARTERMAGGSYGVLKLRPSELTLPLARVGGGGGKWYGSACKNNIAPHPAPLR